jgi:hypothetical protein
VAKGYQCQIVARLTHCNDPRFKGIRPDHAIAILHTTRTNRTNIPQPDRLLWYLSMIRKAHSCRYPSPDAFRVSRGGTLPRLSPKFMGVVIGSLVRSSSPSPYENDCKRWMQPYQALKKTKRITHRSLKPQNVMFIKTMNSCSRVLRWLKKSRGRVLMRCFPSCRSRTLTEVNVRLSVNLRLGWWICTLRTH